MSCTGASVFVGRRLWRRSRNGCGKQRRPALAGSDAWMTETSALVVAVFVAVYIGMALGRWPGLKIDRTGIALLGAIVLCASGIVSGGAALAAINLPTLLVLFGLMILSAQFAACGFYDWCSARIAATDASPAAILALTVAVAGALSAVLANDIVVFAMTPMLVRGLVRRRLDPRPYLIALAGAANAGSAATVIGNPQNILIGQVGSLDFWPFFTVCAPPPSSRSPASSASSGGSGDGGFRPPQRRKRR